MKQTLLKTPSTRLTEDHDPVVTNLTLDFSGLTDEDVQEIAAQAAVIKWQSNARKGKAIPITATYKVPKPGTRGSLVVDYAQALVKLFGGDKAMILIRKYGTAELAYEAIAPALSALVEDEENTGKDEETE